MIINTKAIVPDELGHAWLQHLRDFDAKHPGCHFRVVAETDLTTLEVVEALQEIKPAFPTLKVVARE